MSDTALQKTNGGREVAIRREEFGATEERQVPETAATVMAAQAKAAVEARIIQALQRPRDHELFRVRMLEHCARPAFAEAGWDTRPVGGGKHWKDLTIRFMEVAAATFGNLSIEAAAIYDGEDFQIIRCTVVDLEANVPWTEDIRIAKEVERRGSHGKPPEGRTVLGERTNSSGHTTYRVVATEDEMIPKTKALISKTLRTLIGRLIDPDVLAECRVKIQATRKSDIAKDPRAALRNVIDGFAALNIEPSDLRDYIGVTVERAQPAHIEQLRDAYKLVSSGEMTWEEIMAADDPQHGSLEDQERVRDEKLAKLRKPKEAKAQPQREAAEPPEGAAGKQSSGEVVAFEAALKAPVSELPTEDEGPIEDGVIVFWKPDDGPGEFRKWNADDGAWQKAELPTASKPKRRIRFGQKRAK
jgi:hypothetical protein